MRLRSTLALLLACVFVVSLAAVALADVWVDPYVRSDGTPVKGHWRSDPDGDPYNNWSFPGNTNPYTLKVAPGNPFTYLKNYYNQNSTSGSYDSYPSDNQTTEDWLLRIGDSEESKGESESISESPDPYQVASEWLENMRKNKEFEEWFIRYRKERGGLSQENISELYYFHLAIPSATPQEFIELFDTLSDIQSGSNSNFSPNLLYPATGL